MKGPYNTMVVVPSSSIVGAYVMSKADARQLSWFKAHTYHPSNIH